MNRHEQEVIRRLAERFPAQKNFPKKTIERFAIAIERWETARKGQPPERWLIKEFGG
jgi:hypothetical protein